METMTVTKTYTLPAGQNYISSFDLIYTTIYMVKREGILHEPNSSSDPNRTHTYSPAEGRIYFPLPGNENGERVFVMFKKTSFQQEPSDICAPPNILMPSLPDGIANLPYNFSSLISGSKPLNIVINTKPDWMTIGISVMQSLVVGGIPDADGTFLVEFDVFNECGVDSISQEIIIAQNQNNIQVIANGNYKKITAVTGISFIVSEGVFPLSGGNSVMGVHGGYTGIISVQVVASTFGFPYPLYLRLSKNGTLIESLPVTTTGSYAFSSQIFLDTDFIQIALTI